MYILYNIFVTVTAEETLTQNIKLNMNRRYLTTGLTKVKSSSYPCAPLRLPPMAKSIQMFLIQGCTKGQLTARAKLNTRRHNDDDDELLILF